MSKKQIKNNYLDNIPCKKEGIGWNTDENGIVSLEIENKGIFNRLFQLILKKPKITYMSISEKKQPLFMSVLRNTSRYLKAINL